MKSASRWRVKGKLKIILILLFIFSALFISYQLVYYTSLTRYQLQESHHLLQNSKSQSVTEEATNNNHNNNNNNNNKKNTNDLHNVNTKKRSGIGKPIFSGSVLGVAPEYWHFYTRQQQRNPKYFNCLTSSKKISWSKVNDDYCDCIDGSDEPATPACMNGRFFCTKTAKNFPEYIPSSRVNDGIKDCFDGSDEY